MVSECGRVPLFVLLTFGCGARVALGHHRRRRKEFQNRRLLVVVCFVYIILGCFIFVGRLYTLGKITGLLALSSIVNTSCVLDCVRAVCFHEEWSVNGRRIVSDAHHGNVVPNRISSPQVVLPDQSCIMSVLASHKRRYPFRTARGVTTLARDTQCLPFKRSGYARQAVASPWFCIEFVVFEKCPKRAPHVAFVDMRRMVWIGCSVFFRWHLFEWSTFPEPAFLRGSIAAIANLRDICA